LSPQMLALLHPVGCPSWFKAKTWRLHFGPIIPQAFVAVDSVGAGGCGASTVLKFAR
jgi:hypothetical protein